VTINGPANADVALLVAEAAFFEPAGGAFDPDPFEANSVVVVNEYAATLDSSGSATIPVTLANQDPASEDAYGFNYMTAVVLDPDGNTSLTSNVEVVVYDPDYQPTQVLFRINNGGPQIAAADASEPDWSEDQVTSGASNAAQTGTPSPYVNSGEIAPHSYGVTNTITLDGSVPPSAPMELFQMERWDDDTAPEMQWDFPIPEGTEVEVRLYLAEIFDGITGTGQRVFDVSVEGSIPTAFNDLDPYALTGGLYTGAMVSTTTIVADGDNLDIDFFHITENPAVKGIEIIQLAASPTVTITDPQDGDVFFTDTVDVSWESSNLTAEINHAHLYIDTEVYEERISMQPLDHTYPITGLTPGDHFVIVKLADASHNEIPGAEDRVDFTVEAPGTPEAFIQVNPGTGFDASTYTAGSFQIQNTGDSDITSMTLDLSTAWMMDVVFDPEGTAGDATGKCLTVDSGGAATGFVTPTDPCTDPFSVFHNGVDADDGYDVLTLNFNDFNPGESFSFSADLDPTSIKDATDTGDAGAISGFELIGASVSVEFAGEVVHESNLFDEGTLGGSAAMVTPNEAPAPTIDLEGVTVPTTLGIASQTVLITGTPNANFSILQPVARLYIDDVTPGYDIDPYESNEALAKALYSGTFDGSGNASVPVTLLIASSPDAGPDANLNHFIAVEENAEGDFGLTSNSFVVEYVPLVQEAICINTGGGDYTASDGLFFLADTYFTSGSTYSVTEEILNTEDDTLFQTERYGDPFSYNIPVDNGDYVVELMFAELYHGVAAAGGDGVPGDRVFSVDLEGATVLSDYDIIAEAGAPLTAITETFQVSVSDGSIDLSFYLGENGVDNAKVSAICVTPANEPPTADAGEDQTVTDTDLSGDEEVTLDGSGSSDSDGTIVSYSWNDGGGEIATGVNPTVTLPIGTHTIVLTVTDDDGDTATDVVSITVNDPPTADAGEDQTVTDNDESGDEDITLDGSGSSDSDGTIVSYSWSNGSGEIATGVNPTVTLPVGTHTITLTVTDDDGSTATDIVEITINSYVNEAPTADAGEDQIVTDEDDSGDEDITLDGSGSSDLDGTIVSYSWSDGNGEIATGVNPTVTLSVGTHTLTLTVTDDDGATDTDTVTIIIEEKYPFDYFMPLILN
jgi:phospholipase/lecithinase/hemolysin